VTEQPREMVGPKGDRGPDAVPPPTDQDTPTAPPATSRPRAERHTRSGGRRVDTRWYTDYEGNRYWSVTTLLKGVPKEALIQWSARVTAESAIDDMDLWRAHARRRGRDGAIASLSRVRFDRNEEAIDRGTAVHAAIQAWVLEQPLPADLTELEERYVLQFLSFLEAHQPEIYAAELTVFNRSQWYAGTLDLIAKLPRLPGAPLMLVDSKTGSGVYPESALQLSAYRRAEFAEVQDGRVVEMPAVDACAVLHLTPDRWDLIPVETLKVRETSGAERDVFKTFLYVREVYRWLYETSVSVVGAPFPVPPKGDARPTMIELATTNHEGKQP
jgi:hypothetical protein